MCLFVSPNRLLTAQCSPCVDLPLRCTKLNEDFSLPHSLRTDFFHFVRDKSGWTHNTVLVRLTSFIAHCLATIRIKTQSPLATQRTRGRLTHCMSTDYSWCKWSVNWRVHGKSSRFLVRFVCVVHCVPVCNGSLAIIQIFSMIRGTLGASCFAKLWQSPLGDFWRYPYANDDVANVKSRLTPPSSKKTISRYSLITLENMSAAV